MAKLHKQGGASALPTFDVAATVGQKVARLPSAAARKIRNPQSRAAYRARKELPRFPDVFIFPGQREAFRRIDALRAMEPTPAVNIVRNLLECPDRDDASRVLRMINMGDKAGDPFAREVITLMRQVSGQTRGEVSDFAWAMARMAEGSL